MLVKVGFSDNPDTAEAGRKAVQDALRRVNRPDSCDLVLLFATGRHDAATLRAAVARGVGTTVPIVGGAAVGVITNEHYGYSGDQVGLALIWLEEVRYELFVEGGLGDNEIAAGERLGKRLAANGIRPDSPVVLLYDAIDRSQGVLHLVMAVYLLQGLEQGLGFFPTLVGGGLQGDYIASASQQWTGNGIDQHTALALTFSDELQLDHSIMHGCRPGTGYYTVTRSEEQVILEINGKPALEFMDTLLKGVVPVESYPFFLLLGVNNGNKWGEFDEASYASRLCLGIDKERNAIIMFEPDMVPGTVFQVMYRTLDYGYMIPRIDSLFTGLQGRKPVFALYIDCAGRAAGYGGVELEDALVVQKAVANRVPLLGIYSGVEIAPVEGRPRGLDWTGVFCLFSVPE